MTHFTHNNNLSIRLQQSFCTAVITFVLAFITSVNCNAQATFTDGNLSYKITSSTAQVTGLANNSYTGTLTIPSTVTYLGTNYDVTSIATSAFSNKTGLTGDLIIPDNITSVGNNAFYQCSGFNGTLTISSNLTKIDYNTFYGCTGLTGSVTIPAGVTSIGTQAFYYCHSLNGTLTIPYGVKKIDKSAFYDCYNLKGPLTIPNSVNSLGESAFYDCLGFTGNLTISNKLTAIAKKTFENCLGLTGSVTIPANITSIGSSAFSSCTNLLVEVSSGYHGSIGDAAFDGVKGVWFTDTTPLFTTTTGSTGIGKNTTYYIPEDDNAADAQGTGSIKASYKTNVISTDNVIFRYYHLGLKTVERNLATMTSAKYGSNTAGVATLYVNFPALVPTGLTAYYGKSVPSTDVVKIKSIDNTLNSSYTKPSICDAATHAINSAIPTDVSNTIIPTTCAVVLLGDVIDNVTVFEAATTSGAIEPIGNDAEKGILKGSLKDIATSNVTGGIVYTFGTGTNSHVVGFYPYTGTTLAAHKAYLVVANTAPSKESQFILSIDDEEDNQATAISDIKDNGNTSDNAPYYNLQGIRVETPTKGGIYIHNGKKIVIY